MSGFCHDFVAFLSGNLDVAAAVRRHAVQAYVPDVWMAQCILSVCNSMQYLVCALAARASGVAGYISVTLTGCYDGSKLGICAASLRACVS